MNDQSAYDQLRNEIIDAMRLTYPKLFETPEIEREFRAAMVETLESARRMSPLAAGGNMLQNLANFMEADLVSLETKILPEMSASERQALGENPEEHVLMIVRNSYHMVLDAVARISDGVEFPASACDCPEHDQEFVKSHSFTVLSGDEITDEEMDRILQQTKGQA